AVRRGPPGAAHRRREPGGRSGGRVHRSADPGRLTTGMSTPTRIELTEVVAARPGVDTAPQATWRRLARLRWGVGAAGVLLLIIATPAFAPFIPPYDPLTVAIPHRPSPPAGQGDGTAQP